MPRELTRAYTGCVSGASTPHAGGLRVALFLPRVAVDVIAVHLPEAGLVAVHEDDAAHPLRALPEVQLRDDQAQRPSVLLRQRFAVVLVGEQYVVAHQLVEGDVRRVTAVRV